jgi:hypothetical protein
VNNSVNNNSILKNSILMLSLLMGMSVLASSASAASPCKNGKCAPAPTPGPKLTHKGPSGVETCYNKPSPKCVATDPTDY